MTPPLSFVDDYSENRLVQQPAIELLAELGWETRNLFSEWENGKSIEGRETEHEVIMSEQDYAST